MFLSASLALSSLSRADGARLPDMAAGAPRYQ